MKSILTAILLFVCIHLSSTDFDWHMKRSIMTTLYPQKAQIIDKIFDYAHKYNADPFLLCAMALTESSMCQYAYNVNRNGSIDRGLFQLNSNSYPKTRRNKFYEPDYNIVTGIAHINKAIKKGGSVYNGLSIYNCGHIKIKSAYAEKILKLKKSFDNHLRPVSDIFPADPSLYHFHSLTSFPAIWTKSPSIFAVRPKRITYEKAN